MMVLVLVVALVNLALGYFLAVHFGYGPPGLIEAWEALFAAPAPSVRDRPAEPTAEQSERTGEQAEAEPSQPLDEGSQPGEQTEARGEQAQTDDEQPQPPDELNEPDEPAEPLDDPAQPDDGPAQADVVPAESERSARNPAVEDAGHLDDTYVEVCILKLNVAMLESGDRCTAIDSRLRACRGQTDAETIAECLKLLEEDCRTYLAAQSRAARQLRDRVDEFGELSDLAEEIELANLEQAAQIETTLSNLQHMDFTSDLEAAGERLVAELGKLREARNRLHDNQEAAFLAVARHQQRLDKIEPRLHHDPLTDLLNRIGMEVTMAQWWQEGRQRSRTITAAMLDINGFAHLNQQHGPAVADRVLAGLGRLLHSAAAGADLLGRFSGQQFLVVKLDEGARAAIRRAETIRQSIQRSTFHAEGKDLHLTASAGYAAVLPEDTLQDLFDRLRAALKEAKQAGDNQAFFHDGQRIEQILPPHLGAKPIEATV